MQLNPKKRYIGIMVCETAGSPPFPEKRFFRQLCLVGEKLGVHVFIFSPRRVDFTQMRVIGYKYSKASRDWTKQTFPLPQVIYDRCYYSNKQKYDLYSSSIKKLKKLKSVQFMGYGLKGKWDVQQALQSDPFFLPFLPCTEMYVSAKTLQNCLYERGEAFLKPHAGSHGKGTLYIEQIEPKLFRVKGRDTANQSLEHMFRHEFSMLQWVRRFTDGRKYLVQEYLDLNTPEGNPFDIRSLIQKDGRGMWQLTGMAVRRGQHGSITSNLHGGGEAEDVETFLIDQFGADKTAEVMSLLQEISLRIPETLERHHGRLAELGIDFGVDASGRVWILEVNSKPGRSVFHSLENAEAKKRSVENPIRYARYLLERQLGG